jgi:hypothetical protein
MRLMVTNSAPVRVLSLVDDQIRARIVECDGHIILSGDFKGLSTKTRDFHPTNNVHTIFDNS